MKEVKKGERGNRDEKGEKNLKMRRVELEVRVSYQERNPRDRTYNHQVAQRGGWSWW